MTASEDAFWRRPPGTDAALEPPPPVRPPVVGAYTGPPRTAPPPAGWRPPLVLMPLPPRELPVQDHTRVDREEQAAAIFTKGVGIIAGAVIVALLLLFCGRVIF